MLGIIFKIGGIAITTELISQLLKHSGRAAESNVVSIIGFLIVVGLLIMQIMTFFESISVFSQFIS